MIYYKTKFTAPAHTHKNTLYMLCSFDLCVLCHFFVCNFLLQNLKPDNPEKKHCVMHLIYIKNKISDVINIAKIVLLLQGRVTKKQNFARKIQN